MKKQPSDFLRLLFACFAGAFLIGAVCMPDRSEMLQGLWRIASKTAKIPTNYFDPSYGGYAGAFLNAGLICLIMTALFCLPAAKPNAASVIAFLLTAGFSFWGINLLNLWFGFAGVALYCLVKKVRLGTQVNAMLFTTGLAPLISDLLLAYPHAEAVGFHWQGVLLALLVGLVIGFFLPAGLAASASIHKGFDLYSAALPVGMTAFFLHFLLYGVIGAARGNGTGATTLLTYAAPTAVNVFCLSLFGLCIVFALLFGCKPKDYLSLLKDSGYGVDFSQKYGPAAMLMNVGVFGLFILAYYDLVALLSGNGAVFNGVTFGCIFCMLATCCSGSHPRNVLPVILGYVAASMLLRLVSGALPETDFKLTLDAQAILIGLCFANGLSPISGRFGPLWGIVAGALHYCLVTGVPLLHGAFCLYNGGFTAAIVCILLVPVLEHFSKRAKQ